MSISLNSGVPATPSVPMVQADGTPTKSWYSFFVTLWQRTGGTSASASPILDLIADTVGATLYRGPSVWEGLAAGTQFQALRQGPSAPEWDWLDGNSFRAQASNAFFVGPVGGAAAIPTFRDLASADLSPIAGAIPGVASSALATTGNVGEYVSANGPVGSAVPLTTTATANVASISLSPGDWDVWGTIAFTGSGTISAVNAWLSATSSTDPGAPNSGAYVSASSLLCAPIGTIRAGIGSAATPFYLSTNATFTGSISAYGFLAARRVR